MFRILPYCNAAATAEELASEYHSHWATSHSATVVASNNNKKESLEMMSFGLGPKIDIPHPSHTRVAIL